MLRYLAGVVSALLLVGAGVFVFRSNAAPDPLPAAPARSAPAAIGQTEASLPDALPEASPKSREQKRFDRLDKDRDAKITREEYLLGRRKAFAKLDVNGDGRLAFDEWAVKAVTKFGGADRDGSGTLSPPEFATTAVKRKPRARCACPPSAPVADD